MLVALALVGGGVAMISGSVHNRTETLTARVYTDTLAYSHEDVVELDFPDGSNDSVGADESQELFNAVDKFGPGTARVTRTTQSQSIHTVEFHGKTYEIGSQTDDRLIGIICVVLGVLVLGFVLLDRYVPDPTNAGAAAKGGA